MILAVMVFVFWRFFLPGPHVATDLHHTFNQDLISQFSQPSTWGSAGAVGLGEYAVGVLWAWPIHLIFGLFGRFGFSHDFLMKIIGLPPILIMGTFSIYKLLEYLKVGKWGRLIGILVYLLNSYFILLIDGGQIGLALSYSLLPLGWLFYKRYLELKSLRELLIFLFVTLAISIFDIRIIYFLVLLIAFDFLFNLLVNRDVSFSLVASYIKLAFISGIVLLAFNGFWIFPSYFSRAPSLPATYTRTAQTSFLNFTQLKHSISLLQPHWYENVFGKIPPFRKEFLLIPILAFLAPILKRKDKRVWFWTTVAVVSVFLTKGANPPLPGVYPWLFTHIPGLSLFRDSTKFFFLITLSYSVLIAFTVDEIAKRLPKFKVLFPLLLIFYLLFLIRPVYLGKMTGTLSEPAYKNEYLGIAEQIGKDLNFGRIFWISTKAPLGYSSYLHPSVEAGRLGEERPFASATVGTYETLNHLREASYMGQLLDILGIKYLIYPYPDTRREDLDEEKVAYYHTFLGQLSGLPWVGSVTNFGTDQEPVPALETKSSQDHFFVAPATWTVLGSDSIYKELSSFPQFNLSKNAFLFLEEKPKSGENIDSLPFSKVLLYGKSELDLVANFFNQSSYVFPAKYLDFSPSNDSGSSSWPASNALRSNAGWWKREAVDTVWFRDFLQQKYGIDNSDFDYGGGWAVAEGAKSLIINHQSLTIGNVLLARVMKSNRGGEVEFYQGDTLVGKIDTKIEKPEKVKIKLSGYKEIPDTFFEYDKADFQWFEVGQLTINHKRSLALRAEPLTIKTEGDINVVNALVSVTEAELITNRNRINELIHQSRIIYWDKLSNAEKQNLFNRETSKITVSYERKAPTLYKVKVEGLKTPVSLVFSETYDPLWEIKGGSGSYPLYSLVNGFKIEKDGTYEIYFSPQKYVLPGLIVSGATLIFLIWKIWTKM